MVLARAKIYYFRLWRGHGPFAPPWICQCRWTHLCWLWSFSLPPADPACILLCSVQTPATRQTSRQCRFVCIPVEAVVSFSANPDKRGGLLGCLAIKCNLGSGGSRHTTEGVFDKDVKVSQLLKYIIKIDGGWLW